MTLTDFETGLAVSVEFRRVKAWKLDGGSTWLKLEDGKVMHVRESMAEIDAKLTGRRVKQCVTSSGQVTR